MNIKKRSDGARKMPLVGWWPIIHRTNFVAGIFRNFEVILGGIRVDDGDEMVWFIHLSSLIN